MPKIERLFDALVDLIHVLTWPIITLAAFLQNLLAKHRAIGAILAIIIFSLSTSGIIYNVQHDMHWFGYDRRTQQRIYIHPHRRSQFLGEGLWFSFLNTSFGLLAALSLFLPNWLANQKIATPMRNPYFITVCSTLCLVACYFAWRTLSAGCLEKAPYLTPTFFPDETFIKGPIRNDRAYAA